MGVAATPLATLLARAQQGWTAEQPEIALGILNKLRNRLRADFEVIQTTDQVITFIADFARIRLRGSSDAACFLVGGDAVTSEPVVRKFWESVSGPEQLVIAFALSEGAVAAIQAAIPQGYACVVGPLAISAILESQDAVQTLREQLLQQIPFPRLIPFVIKHAVQGNMFYGRRNELQRLIDEDAENFAIAGQGRIGKSSLLEEYHRRLVTKKDPRLAAHFLIDCYTCQPKSEAAIAQFWAKQIEGPTYRAKTMSLDDLEPFLRFHSHRLKRKLDLVLDEVDMICGSQAMKILAHLSKKTDGPIGRLILAGRGELLRETKNEDSPLGKHTWLMRLEPLDEASARKLLTEPFDDLGMAFADEKILLDRILKLTGRLPQLLQYFGAQLARLASQQTTKTLVAEHIETIRLSEETTELFMSPIRSVSNPLAEFIALLILEHGLTRLDEALVMRLARSVGISIDADRALTLCDDLLLANFLSWTKTGYEVANEATGIRAKEIGYLDAALTSARQSVQRRFFI